MPRSAFVLAATLVAVGAVVIAVFLVPKALDKGPVARPPASRPPADEPAAPQASATTPAAEVLSPPAPLPEPALAEPSNVEASVDESVEALFERARRIADEGRDFKGAIGLFKQVVARQAEDRALAARALYEIGCCLERMGRPKEAQEAFQMVLERYADQREAADAARRRLPQELQARLNLDDELRKRIQEGRVDLDVVGVPLQDAVSLLREKTRINLLIDESEPSEAFEKEITVRLWNATIAEALDRISSEASARWVIREGCVLLYPRGCTWNPEADKPPTLPAWEADVPAWKQEEESMRAALAATPVSVHLLDANLTDMAHAFQAATTRLIIVVDPLVQDADDKRVTFRVEDLDPCQSLDLICRMLDLAWYVDRGTIHLTTKEAAESWRKEHE